MGRSSTRGHRLQARPPVPGPGLAHHPCAFGGSARGDDLLRAVIGDNDIGRAAGPQFGESGADGLFPIWRGQDDRETHLGT